MYRRSLVDQATWDLWIKLYMKKAKKHCIKHEECDSCGGKLFEYTVLYGEKKLQ